MNTLVKLSLASVLVSAAINAQAGVSIENDMGAFSIGGDVEFNLDYTDKNATNKQELNQNGRILVQVAAEHTVSGDRYIKMQAQPLLDTSGNVNLDDAWFAMGKKADWELKVGRFEAYDLFPVGQDTMLAYATANEPYRANAARGRGDNGQVAFSKTFDSVYFEVASLFKDESNADNNAVFLRPVVAFQATDSFRVAGGLEANVTADKLDPANDFMGYGVTANYSADAVSVNLNYAFRDFDSQTKEQSTIGANLLVSGFGLGHVYAQDETNAVKSKLNTTYASYEIANVWDVDALNIYLGTYYSKQSDSDNKDLGARIRFKYFF
ncbi:porin [Vibrio navarrensis]|uniref:Carbohydrate porin n=1 Tax=Vibrio navarrensis TaxID=29495 RepID=A0AAI9CQR8_9VIBR|nr:carbohydrate porin [Vibrio navarrensis]EGR2796782.1 porin [Vibrio navarrensis]EHA1124237.1 porin [Vibrio navarrensis]EJL6396119.1 carbohydrate porin [Vibrio navarrensis]EKA5637533.1 carbohydrate porin [Vibrio navarrensis]ELN6930674.1 carbohydrate porin [Vibrio navarrensis]